MNKSFCLLVLGLMAVQVHADNSVSVDASGYVAFRHLDSDRNGYVSRVEARSVAGVERAFDVADGNQDGLLNRKEYKRVGMARKAE